MHQHRQRRFPLLRVLIASASIAAVMALAFLLVSPFKKDHNESLPQLGVGQLVRNCGRFKFPNGNRILEVSEDNSGNVCITVHVPSSVVSHIPYTSIPYRTAHWSQIEHRVVVESERDWFVSVDQYDRLWVYYGRWEQKWGDLRELPGGGTRPYAPAVIVMGLSFLQSGGLALGVQVVTDTGNWAGVPARFLEQVRDASKMETDSKWVIPSVAPTFTPEQQVQITHRLEQAD